MAGPFDWLTGPRNSLLDGAPMYQGGPQASAATDRFVAAPNRLLDYARRAVDPQTPDERMAANVVRGFTESPAAITGRIGYHGMSNAADLNYALREGRPLSTEMEATLAEMERYMEPLGDRTTLWRGVKSGPYARAQAGQIISDPALFSTSTSRDQALNFAMTGSGEPALLRIDAPRHLRGARMEYGGEGEIVLPRGQAMRVDEVMPRGPGGVPLVLMSPHE